MIKSDGAVIKTDEAGRVRTPTVRRESLLDEFERSGLSGPKFAGLAGINYQTFAGWVRKRQRQRIGGRSSEVKSVESVRWLEAVVEQARAVGGSGSQVSLVLQLAGGARVELADEKQVALAAVLVRALATPC